MLLGPIGGAVGAVLGKLISGIVPSTAKEKRIHREGSRAKNDAAALKKSPVTDNNIVKRFETGNIIVGLGLNKEGQDIPGTQNPKEFKYYRFTNGKKQILTREQVLSILAKDKTILQTGSNIIGHKLLEAYKQVKAANLKAIDDAKKIEAAKKDKVKQDAAQVKATTVAVSNSVKDVLAKSGINKDLKTVIDTQKKQAKTVEDKLANIIKQQLVADKQRLTADKQHKEDHLTIGKMIKLVSDRANETGNVTTALSTVLQNNAAIPKKYQNLFGGKGFIKLINKS